MRRRHQWLAGPATAVVLVVGPASPARADLPGTGIVKDVIGGAAGWSFDAIAGGIGGWVLGAVSFFVNGALNFLRTAARPDVEAAWFAGPDSPYAAVRDIALLLLVGFVFLGLLQGLVHGDPIGMLRRIAGNLPLAVAGMVVTTAVVGRLLALTDVLSEAVLAGSGDDALHFLSGFGMTVSGATQGFAAVVLGLVAVIAALLLWVELIVRASLVYLLVAISPIGFAATLWPTARGLLRKIVELLLAVIVSKFVICVALAIGVAALAGAGGAANPAGVPTEAGVPAAAPMEIGLSTLLVGAVILGLAAFAPFLVLKLIPLAEGALVAHGISRSPGRAAQTGMATYSTARNISRLSGGGSGGSGAAAATGGPTVGPSATASAAGNGASAAGANGASVAAPVAVAGAATAGAASAASGRVRNSTTTHTAMAEQEPRPPATNGDKGPPPDPRRKA